MKRIKGTNWTVNVTIIDLKDKGPDINFFLQKKKLEPPHSPNVLIYLLVQFWYIKKID